MAAEVASRCGTDASYVFKADQGGVPRKILDGPNGDLWLKYKDVLEARGIQGPLMYKVKAHAEDLFLSGQMDALDYLGNLIADLAAGIIADDEVNTILDDDINQWQGVAYHFANRISS